MSQVIGEDACPGVKQNGFPYLIRRQVECLCPGDAIPAAIEVDISGLNLGQTVLLPQLKLPEGVKMVALVQPFLVPCLLWLALQLHTRHATGGPRCPCLQSLYDLSACDIVVTYMYRRFAE